MPEINTPILLIYEIYTHDALHGFDGFFHIIIKSMIMIRGVLILFIFFIRSVIYLYSVPWCNVFDKILNAKLNPDSYVLSFKVILKIVSNKNLLHANKFFSILKVIKSCICQQYLFMCMGNNINNSILPAQSAPLHSV